MNRLKLSKLSEFLSSSGGEFQTVGPAWSNARQPYVLSRHRGTVRQFLLANRRRPRRGAASEAGFSAPVVRAIMRLEWKFLASKTNMAQSDVDD